MTDDEPSASRRARGLETMKRVYGWEDVGDAPGDFFGITVEHLFAEVWNREPLTDRERRLLLIGLLTGMGEHDVAELQIDAALNNEELSAVELREIALFLVHYAGWPRGTKLNMTIEKLVAQHGGPPPGP
jgi:4-carboxymuconolactone decarboxylase